MTEPSVDELRKLCGLLIDNCDEIIQKQADIIGRALLRRLDAEKTVMKSPTDIELSSLCDNVLSENNKSTTPIERLLATHLRARLKSVKVDAEAKAEEVPKDADEAFRQYFCKKHGINPADMQNGNWMRGAYERGIWLAAIEWLKRSNPPTSEAVRVPTLPNIIGETTELVLEISADERLHNTLEGTESVAEVVAAVLNSYRDVFAASPIPPTGKQYKENTF